MTHVCQIPPEDLLQHALEITVKLWDAGIRGSEGCTILGIALGVYLDADEAISRAMVPEITNAVGRTAQHAFDTFRLASTKEAGNA